MILYAGILLASLDIAPWIAILGTVTGLASALTALFLFFYRHDSQASSKQTIKKKLLHPLPRKTLGEPAPEKTTEKQASPIEPSTEKKLKLRSFSVKEQPESVEPSSPIDKEMLESIERAHRLDTHVNAYREKLLTDRTMKDLKILTMTWQLNLLQVYVRLRLHQGMISGAIEPDMRRAEETRDPNILLRVERDNLERQLQEAIDPRDAIARYRRCIILGEPGAGKTTLLKYLTLQCANKELVGLSNLPVYIDLHRFVQSDDFREYLSSGKVTTHTENCINPLLTFAVKEWDKRYDFPWVEAREYLLRELETGNALLLLDGLDETFIGETPEEADKTYEQTRTIIQQLIDVYSSAFIAITARTAGYRQRVPLNNVAELEVLEFRKQDIEQFLRNWFRNPPKNNLTISDVQPYEEEPYTDGIPSQLKVQIERPRVQALASKPLLLALIIITYQKGRKSLPERRADLYKACIDTLFTWDDKNSQNASPLPLRQFSRENKENLLKRIAWHFHEKGQRYFPRNELLGVIASYQKDLNLDTDLSAAILNEITLENGLIKEQATGWYSFLHLTLQEYFTALAVKEDRGKENNKYARLLQHLEDPWWEEVILLYAGSCDDASSLLKELGKKEEYPAPTKPAAYFHTNLILAGQCLAMHPAISNHALRETIKHRLIKELQDTHQYQLTRRQLAETLCEIADEKTAPLAADTTYYRLNISGKRDQDEVRVEDYITAILSGEMGSSREVQLSLVRAAGLFQHPGITQTLLESLANEMLDVEVRMVMAQTLSICGTSSMVETLISILSQPHVNLEVRQSIAGTIGSLLDESSVPELIQLASNSRNPIDLRCAIVDALGESGKRVAIQGLLNVRNGEKPSSRVHWRCAIALAKLGEFAYVDEVLTLLSSDQSSSSGRQPIISVDVPRSIVMALGSLRLSSLVPSFMKLLSDERIPWEVRVSITVALEATNDASPSIIADLITLLSNEQLDPFVRGAVGNLIGSLGDKRYIGPLQRLRLDEQDEPRVYRSVKTALCKLGDTSVIADLLCWIEHYEKEGIEPAECLNMLDALRKFPAVLNTQQCESLLRLATTEYVVEERPAAFPRQPNRKFDTEIRQNIIAFLPQLAYEKFENGFAERVIAELYGILEKQRGEVEQRILNEAHHALWTMQRYDRHSRTQ